MHGSTLPLTPADAQRIRAFLLAYPGVTAIREVLVTFIGPGRAWVIARLDVADDLRGAQVESLVRGIESGMKRESEAVYRVGRTSRPAARRGTSGTGPTRPWVPRPGRFRLSRRTSHCRPRRPVIRNPSARPALRHDGRPAGLPGSNAAIARVKSRSACC